MQAKLRLSETTIDRIMPPDARGVTFSIGFEPAELEIANKCPVHRTLTSEIIVKKAFIEE